MVVLFIFFVTLGLASLVLRLSSCQNALDYDMAYLIRQWIRADVNGDGTITLQEAYDLAHNLNSDKSKTYIQGAFIDEEIKFWILMNIENS